MADIESLVHNEPVGRRLERHGLNRLLLLADAVFAIAITLAALEIKPHGEWKNASELWWALRYPLFAYLLSFGVIAIYWVVHRDTFARVARADGGATVLSLLHLFTVALLPALTQLLYEDFSNASLCVYAAGVAACGFTQASTWAWVAFRPQLLTHPMSRAYRLTRLGTSLLIPLYFSWIAWLGGRFFGGAALFGAFGVVAVLAVVRFLILPRLHPGPRR